MNDQIFRLINIYIAGPAMIRGAKREKNKFFKYGLAIAGFATIVYNGKQYQNELNRQRGLGNVEYKRRVGSINRQ